MKTPLENPVCVLYKLDCETVSHLMRPMNEVRHFDRLLPQLSTHRVFGIEWERGRNRGGSHSRCLSKPFLNRVLKACHSDGIAANGPAPVTGDSRPVTHLMIFAGSMLAARRAGNNAASKVATNETALTERKSLARIRVGRAVIKYNPPGISSGRNLK